MRVGLVVVIGQLALAVIASAAHAAPSAPAQAQIEPGLVIGELPLVKIVDGDTIKVDGLDGSLRLLGIDTEETFKRAADRRAAEDGLETYRASKRGDAARPVKLATPMGEAAKAFAIQFFAGVTRVRLERDHPAEIRDRYNRYLAYVFIERGGKRLNYNVECVRAGMSPYFPKYGTSRRFHAELVAAEAEARRARRGIWAPDAPGYADYAEREAWWRARGAFVDAFRAATGADHIDLSHEDALDRLEARLGKPVVVLGVVGDVRGERPAQVMLARRIGGDFPVIFFDRGVLAASGIAAWKGEYVEVHGVVSRYEHRRSHVKQLQIVVERARQVRLSPVPGLVPPGPEAP